MVRALRIAALVLWCGGCALAAPIPLAHVQHGPAIDQPVHRIAALPTRCIASSPDECQPGYAIGIDALARMELELDGRIVVDTETVNVRTRDRLEVVSGDDPATAQTERGGTAFADAAAADQQAVLDGLAIDSVLGALVVIGPPRGFGGSDRTIEVDLQLVRRRDDALVWRSRCAVIAGNDTWERALERATRCALEAEAASRSLGRGRSGDRSARSRSRSRSRRPAACRRRPRRRASGPGRGRRRGAR
jgi:hypothetical protein